jgi:hypothetical protein
MQKIKENLKPIVLIIGLLTFFTTMFSEEIKTLLLSHWKTVSFLISALLIIFALSLYYMEYFCKELLKSKFSDVITQNKKLSQLNDLYLHNLIIDHLFINEIIIDKMDDDELLRLCIEVYRKFRIPINDKKENIPNFKNYGIKENVLKRFEIFYNEEKNKKLKDEIDSKT